MNLSSLIPRRWYGLSLPRARSRSLTRPRRLYACQPHPYGVHLHRYRWVAWLCLWGKRLAFLVNGGWKAEAKSRTITVGDRQYLRLPNGELRKLKGPHDHP